jgi:hypothetical protein
MADRKTDPSRPDATGNTAKDPEDWTTGDEPMTGSQRSYLKTLCEEAGEPLDETLTKAQAAKRIDQLQQQTGRGLDAPRRQGPPAAGSRPHEAGSSGNTVKDPEDWTTGDEPMTGAQRSYLQTLCAEAGEPLDEPLTKAQASVRIAALQQRTGRGRARGARDQAEEGSDEAEMHDIEGAADEEGLEEVCPGCGLERNAWQGNGGRGYPTDGGFHCCQACAEGVDCTCTAQGAG